MTSTSFPWDSLLTARRLDIKPPTTMSFSLFVPLEVIALPGLFYQKWMMISQVRSAAHNRWVGMRVFPPPPPRFFITSSDGPFAGLGKWFLFLFSQPNKEKRLSGTPSGIPGSSEPPSGTFFRFTRARYRSTLSFFMNHGITHFSAKMGPQILPPFFFSRATCGPGRKFCLDSGQWAKLAVDFFLCPCLQHWVWPSPPFDLLFLFTCANA